MLLDLSVAIMQVTVSVAIMQLEVSVLHLQVKVSAVNMMQGQVLLKGEGAGTFLPFRNYFTLCKIMLWISRKIIFVSHHSFMKESNSKLSKNEPENIP